MNTPSFAIQLRTKLCIDRRGFSTRLSAGVYSSRLSEHRVITADNRNSGVRAQMRRTYVVENISGASMRRGIQG